MGRWQDTKSRQVCSAPGGRLSGTGKVVPVRRLGSPAAAAVANGSAALPSGGSSGARAGEGEGCSRWSSTDGFATPVRSRA